MKQSTRNLTAALSAVRATILMGLGTFPLVMVGQAAQADPPSRDQIIRHNQAVAAIRAQHDRLYVQFHNQRVANDQLWDRLMRAGRYKDAAAVTAQEKRNYAAYQQQDAALSQQIDSQLAQEQARYHQELGSQRQTTGNGTSRSTGNSNGGNRPYYQSTTPPHYVPRTSSSPGTGQQGSANRSVSNPYGAPSVYSGTQKRLPTPSPGPATPGTSGGTTKKKP